MLLTDTLSADGVDLLQVIMSGTPPGTVAWPVWQWVDIMARRRGFDPVAALNELPTWQHFYRPVIFPSQGVPQPGDRIGLTVHGLVRAGDIELVTTFLAALAEGLERRADIEPSPSQVVSIKVLLEALTGAAQKRAGTVVRAGALHYLLEHEPATWMGWQTGNPQGPEWDLAACPPAMPYFEGVTDPEDYLRRLDAHIVGLPPGPMLTATPVTDPITLHDGLDHLSLVWRQRTGASLLRIPRAVTLGELTLPVTSGPDFTSRCSRLDDLFKAMQPGGKKADPKEGTLAGIERRLGELVADPDTLEDALAAVGVLRDVNRLRVAQQHTGHRLDVAAFEARRRLGLANDRGDWTGDWNRVRGQVVAALREIRTAVDPDE